MGDGPDGPGGFAGQKRGRQEGKEIDTDEEMQESFKRSCFLPSSSPVANGGEPEIGSRSADVNSTCSINGGPKGQRGLSFSEQYGSMNQLLKQLHMERQQRLQQTQRSQQQAHFCFAAPANTSHQVPNQSSERELRPESVSMSSGGDASTNGVHSHADTEGSAAIPPVASTEAQYSVHDGAADSSCSSNSRKRGREGEPVAMPPRTENSLGRKRYRRRDDVNK
eukprot:gb/GECG01007204.1/.p1 GENE.gb/GECG01007204.1/~~gb/GECG01007204.1/.p1  ORF type:complete len:223 (+),score=34.41 gb/GECG01007204.1/:1-669(+)